MILNKEGQIVSKILIPMLISICLQSFGQVYVLNESDSTKMTLTHYVGNYLSQENAIEEIFNSGCENGMVLISFKISNENMIYAIKTSFDANRKIVGFTMAALKDIKKLWFPPENNWVGREFIMPIIYRMNCKTKEDKLNDKSFKSLLLLKNFEFQPDFSNQYSQEFGYRDCILVQPLYMHGPIDYQNKF